MCIEKGKPVERQGRKVSDLRGKTYDSGAAEHGFRPLPSLYKKNKGDVMQPAIEKPALATHPAAPSTLSDTLGRAVLGSCRSPSSPKTQELRARYEALHATQGELKAPDADRSHQE